jgi:hypothetical protein
MCVCVCVAAIPLVVGHNSSGRVDWWVMNTYMSFTCINKLFMCVCIIHTHTYHILGVGEGDWRLMYMSYMHK